MELELFSGAFFSALLAIILIDLVLAGDNALIIGLVARNLPRRARTRSSSGAPSAPSPSAP